MKGRRGLRAGLVAACLVASVPLSAAPATSAKAYKAKFYVLDVRAKAAAGKTKVTVKYKIVCPGNRFHAGIGFANAVLDIWTIKNGWVKKQGEVSKSFDLAKGAYTAGAAEVRCYDGGEYVGGAFPPTNKGSQKPFQVK